MAMKFAVEDLKSRLEQKEESIENYRGLLEKLKQQMKQQQQQHDRDIDRLNKQIENQREFTSNKIKKDILYAVSEDVNINKHSDIQTEQIRKLEDQLSERDRVIGHHKQQLQHIVSLERMKAELDKKVMEVEMVCKNKEMILEKTKNEMEHLRSKNFEFQQENIRLSALHLKNQQTLKELEDEKILLESQQKDMIVQQKQHYDQQQQTLLQLENQQLLSKPPHAKQRLLDVTPIKMKMKAPEAHPPLSKYASESLKKQLTSKDQKIKAMTKALAEMRTEMVSQAQRQVRSELQEAANQATASKLAEDMNKEYKETIENLNDRLQRCAAENRRLRDDIVAATTDLKVLEVDIETKDVAVKKLLKERDNAINEVKELRIKTEALNNIIRQKPSELETLKTEIESLKRINRRLMESGGISKGAEKPYEGYSQSQLDTLKYERRDWERKMDGMRQELKLKDEEIKQMKASKTSENKDVLRKGSIMKGGKVASSKVSMPTNVDKSSSGNQLNTKSYNNNLINQLKNQVESLTKEREFLKRSLDEMNEQNSMMVETVKKTEKQSQKDKSLIIGDKGYKDFLRKEDAYKKEIIVLTEKNFELNLELERSQCEIPRLKEKVDEKQRYIDVLRSEQKHMVAMNKSRDSLSSISLTSASIKKVGESGRSVHELERIIATLKKIIDKLKQENERLKANNSS